MRSACGSGGRGRKRLPQLEEACRLTPEDAALWVRHAEMRLAMGQLALARAAAETAINLNPRSPAAWAVRGRVTRDAGDLQHALADFHRALGYAPYDRRVLLEVAELHRRMNQPQRALETLQSLADTYNTPAEEPQQVLYLMGLAYVALNRYDDGVESLAAAATRERPTPEILYRLAEAQWLAGNPARGRRHRPTSAGASIRSINPAANCSTASTWRVTVRKPPLRR